MKRIIVTVLLCCIAAAFMSCTHTQPTQAQVQTTESETFADVPAAEEPETEMPQKTTALSADEGPTASVQPLKLSARLETFYKKLCSDRWVEITEDMEIAKRMEFSADGSMKVIDKMVYIDPYGEHTPDEEWEEVYGAEKRSGWDGGETVLFRYGVFTLEDTKYDDCIHMTLDGAYTYHRMMIRESAYNRSRKLADALQDTAWKSDWFACFDIDRVYIKDFDVIPINETTVHLVYHGTVDNFHTAQATVKQTDGADEPDVFLIRTYSDDGCCPETVWLNEQWTQA